MNNELFLLLEVLGTIVFAISGALSAGRKQFDFAGVIFVACVVGNGGGTIRDLLLGATPVFWMQQPIYLFAAILTGIIVFIIAHYIEIPYKVLLLADALGLGIFTIAGTHKALAYGVSPLLAVFMGVITGVGGGLIRDIICRTTPLVLRREIYATAAFVGGIVFVLLVMHLDNDFIPGIACAITVFFIRMASLRWGIHLPAIRKSRRIKRN